MKFVFGMKINCCDAAGETGVTPLADPVIPPSPYKGAANPTKPTFVG
ncbi:hypothetical protein [Tolypothrix sp. FACHB-123]|nr:hypothetical protein [Tolypothrix sp. FACHB-123]